MHMRITKRRSLRRSITNKSRKLRRNRTKRVGGKRRRVSVSGGAKRGGATPTHHFSKKELVSPTQALSDPSFTGKSVKFEGKKHNILSDIDSKNYFIALTEKNGEEVYPKLKTIKRLNKQEKSRSKRK
jgi:hypothetical protein